ncbi:acyltransferase family protein [Nocardia sp. NPDC051570]|uniref:acyltransferase family protein n=1 Tax=Nocardia sp. NPDC051570 TaxID=3364324 RepID=UPI00378C6A00
MTKSDEAVADPIAPVERAVRGRGGRFEFLDALRGLAALAVVIQHCSIGLWPGFQRFSAGIFEPGQFGVFVFFLVSGFIIPTSLERGRSLGAFWVGRFFRLYPLFWACLIAAMIMYAVGRYPLSSSFLTNPVWNLATNATMTHLFLFASQREDLVVGIAWTLTYELVFYMFVSLLFLGRFLPRSVPVAVLALSAMVPLALIPPGLLNGPQANWTTRLGVVIVTALVAAIFALRAVNRRNAVIALPLAVIAVPLVLNQPGPTGYSAAVFATMFVGTVLYRMTRGETTTGIGWGVFGLAVFLITVLWFVTFGEHVDPDTGTFVGWYKDVAAMVGAYMFFGAALLLRRHSFPRPLLFLGRISYSLYLVHLLVLNGLPRWTTSVAGIPAVWLTWCTWVGSTLLIATLTYYALEKPFHDLGHRLIAEMKARARPVPAMA